MTVRDWIEYVLVGIGVGVELICCLGVAAGRSAVERLHYAMAGSSVGPVAIVAAVVVRHSFTQPGINAIVVGAILFLLGPALAHATARAIRVQAVGQLEATERELDEAA